MTEYVISRERTDIKEAIAPEHYGDVSLSCDGSQGTSDGLMAQVRGILGTARAAFSSYPKRPGTVTAYGTASSRGWGSGWPNCSSENIVVVKGGGVRISIREEIAPIVVLLLDYAECIGYDILPGQTGGYACRPIRGTSTASNHSWGLAFDVNWQSNPMSTRFSCDMPPRLVEAFWSCGFYWGGWYSGGRYDTMHFEYIGRPNSVSKHLARARALMGLVEVPAPTATAPVTHAVDSRIVGPDDTGEDVKWIQLRLGFPVAARDGIFGAATQKAVREFQGRNDLEADGVVGPTTFAALRRTQVSLAGLTRAYDAKGTGEPDGDTKQLQAHLNKRGFSCGTPDGYYGEATRSAMTAFRAAKYNAPAGHPDTLGAPGSESLVDLGFSVLS